MCIRDRVFTLFSQMAESEMRTKLARWKRTKDANRKQSIYTGGWLLYGYKAVSYTHLAKEMNSIFS